MVDGFILPFEQSLISPDSFVFGGLTRGDSHSMLTYKSEGAATLRTWKPKTAGIMTIISGFYGIGLGAVSRQGQS